MQQLAKIISKTSSVMVMGLLKATQTLLLAVLIYSGFSNQASAVTFGSVTGSSILEKLTVFSQKNGLVQVSEAEIYGPEVPPTISQSLLVVCENRGYGEECAKTLLGMAWKESNFKSTAVGDGGRARGFFQIHYRLHGISLACAYNLECSANWTIDYLERNGYPDSGSWAIQCHNGCGINNGYASSVQNHGRRLWLKETVGQSVALVQ